MKKEDPTLAAAEVIFNNYFVQRASENPETSQRTSNLPSSSQSNLLSALIGNNDIISNSNSKFSKHQIKEPTEVILRGFKSSQQYAAIREYERIAGRICEDYPREPPIEQKRYKIDSGDPASLRSRVLTPEEKAKVHKFAGGEHWIKVTFESAETAEAAIECSPQKIFGHSVIAEYYHGIAPIDEEILAICHQEDSKGHKRDISQNPLIDLDSQSQQLGRQSNMFNTNYSTFFHEIDHDLDFYSKSDSIHTSTTLDSGTIASTKTEVSASGSTPSLQSTREFCQRIPTARRLQLLPAEQALLPQESPIQKFLCSLPFIGWVSRDIIGGSIPRTDQGEFDFKNASLYWKLIWLIEKITGIILLGDSKDE